MKNSVKKIYQIFAEAAGNTTDIYYSVYEDYFKNSKTPWRELQAVIEYCKNVGSDDNNPQRISENKRQNLIRNYNNALREIVHMLVNEGMELDAFYEKLYKIVFKSGIFPQDDDVQVVLLELMARNYPDLPYYPIHNPLVMTNEDFLNAVQEILPQVRKGMSVVNRGLNSNTEIISQLWSIANELDSDKKKIIFLSAIVGIASRNGQHG